MLGILKPDHLGDLVLSAPAISSLISKREDVRLFVDGSAFALAQTLFPGSDIRKVTLAHLKKDTAGDRPDLADSLAEVSSCDEVVCLRTDAILNRDRMKGLFRRSVFTTGDNMRHESLTQRDQLGPFFGRYDCQDFWPGRAPAWPTDPQRIVFCLGSGFPSNRWPLLRWVELGRLLQKRGYEVSLLRTPNEKAEIAVLARNLDIAENAIITSTSISNLLEQLSEHDVVVASDGGAGHICSLALPILTIAASVPFRRFAPFGRMNRVVTHELPCSPCINYHTEALNGCFTFECSYGISATDVAAALNRPTCGPGWQEHLPNGAKLFFGISHAG